MAVATSSTWKGKGKLSKVCMEECCIKGVPISDVVAPCGAPSDWYGDHALSCARTGYTRRHYDLVHVIRSLLSLNGTLDPQYPHLRVDLEAR